MTGGMQYIQDRDGHFIDELSKFAMRNFALSIWAELGMSGVASSTWGQVDKESKKGYYRAMAGAFFNLRLCDADWKAEQIAVDNYKLWYLRRYPDHGKRNRNESTKAGPSKKSKVVRYLL